VIDKNVSVEQALTNKFSGHFFEKAEVSEDQLRRLVDLALRAPSAFNLQPWRLVVVRDAAVREKLRGVAYGQAKITESSATIVVVGKAPDQADYDRICDEMQAKGLPKEIVDSMRGAAVGSIPTSPIEKAAFLAKHAGLVGAHVLVAAAGLGLDACPMGGFQEEAVKQLLEIPEDATVAMLIVVGKAKAQPQKARLEIGEGAYLDHYGTPLPF
jgi:nitroreductase